MPVWKIMTGWGDESEAGREFSVAADAPVIKTVGGFTRSGATNGFPGRPYVVMSFFSCKSRTPFEPFGFRLCSF